MPDNLVSDTAQVVPLPNVYSGLFENDFEIIYRLKMILKEFIDLRWEDPWLSLTLKPLGDIGILIQAS